MQISHNEKKINTTGVLLAGGMSSRMGMDKACLEVSGQPLYTRALDFLRQYFGTLIIAGDRPDLAKDDIPAIPDIYPGSSLGGLYTGLHAANTDWIFVVACDMPNPDVRILEMLLELRNGYDAVVPRVRNGYEPLFSLYHKNCLPFMEAMLCNNQFRIIDFYQQINVRYLNWTELPEDWEHALMSINTPDDLNRFKECMQ